MRETDKRATEKLGTLDSSESTIAILQWELGGGPQAAKQEGDAITVLRGAIVYRTYGIHKNLPWYIFT